MGAGSRGGVMEVGGQGAGEGGRQGLGVVGVGVQGWWDLDVGVSGCHSIDRLPKL